MAKRVVLAYSGGLDTSVAVRWMIDTYGVEVVTLSADVGQGGDWDTIRDRARPRVRWRRWWSTCARSSPVTSWARPCGPTPSTSSATRWCRRCRGRSSPSTWCDAARQYDCDAVAHGCTGKGNDQVRFEVSTLALAPDLEVLAPVREWGMTREDCIDYAAEHAIPITVTQDKPYSIDDNLWGRAIECGEMEDPWARPPEGVWEMTVERATEAREVVVGFEAGFPVSLDGERAGPPRA